MNRNVAAAALLLEQKFGIISKALEIKETIEDKYDELTSFEIPEGYALVPTELTGKQLNNLAVKSKVSVMDAALVHYTLINS